MTNPSKASYIYLLDNNFNRGKRFWWLMKNRNRNRNRQSFISNNWDTARWGNKYQDNK